MITGSEIKSVKVYNVSRSRQISLVQCKSVYCGVLLVVTVLKNPKRSLHRQQMLNVLRNESTYCFQNSVYNNNHVLLEYSLSSVLVGKVHAKRMKFKKPDDVVFFTIMSSRDKQSVTPFETKIAYDRSPAAYG